MNPSILSWSLLEKNDNYLKAIHEEKMIDYSQCKDCTLSYEEKINLESGNGIKYNNFPPTTYYKKDNARYPLMFCNRQGGGPFLMLKFFFDHFNKKTGIKE